MAGGDGGRLSRRGWLRASGGTLAGAIGGGRLAEPRSRRSAAAERGNAGEPRTDADGRDDFLWLSGAMLADAGVRDNALAFAARNDLAAVLVVADLTAPDLLDGLRPHFDAAAEFGVDLWLDVGILQVPAASVAEDGAARERHLDGLRDVVALYHDRFGDGRVVLWQEAPVSGRWSEDGKWTDASVENLRSHGPAVFAAQRSAVKAVSSGIDVGIFPHFPYVVGSKRPGVFPELVAGCRERDAPPDFAFTDFYRGWYEKDAGAAPADAAVRSLVTNARAAVDAPVFFMAQAHTINPHHTPSRVAMRGDLRTAADAGVDGVGWYSRNRYVPTKVGFDPFLPNRGDPAAFAGRDAVCTFTVARDRYAYAWAATHPTRAGYDADAKFDLWVHGEGVGFHEHRVSLRTAGGDWAFVGDAAGYVDGDYPDGRGPGDGPHVTVFRGLDRERFLGRRLDLRVASRGDATLRSVSVHPFAPDAFVTERRAAALAEAGAETPCCLGRRAVDRRLSAGRETVVRVPVPRDAPALPPDALLATAHDGVRAALRDAEAESGFDPLTRFDLWVDCAAPESLAAVRVGGRDALAAAPAVGRGDEAAVCYGLPRSLLGGGALARAEVDGDAGVAALYAMPYGGPGAFTPPERTAELVAADPDAAATFALGHDAR
ncbi:hypothetical protein [Halostella litorea]|uniref:hypothetical protein n=1 Tax=Halostella litorea TaxID=2528831 RepID=UPI0010927374|nr:hypothetical protein [Halostella litorea]